MMGSQELVQHTLPEPLRPNVHGSSAEDAPTHHWNRRYPLHLPKHMHGHLAHFGALPTEDCPLHIKVKYEVDGQLLPQAHQAKAERESNRPGPIRISGLCRGTSWLLHGCSRDGWSWCGQDGALVMRGSRAQQPAFPAEEDNISNSEDSESWDDSGNSDWLSDCISQSSAGQKRPRQEDETANAEGDSASGPSKPSAQFLHEGRVREYPGDAPGADALVLCKLAAHSEWDSSKKIHLPKHMHGHLAHFGALPTPDCPLGIKVKYAVDGQLLPQVHEARASACSRDGSIGMIGLTRGASWELHGCTKDGWSWCDQDGALVMRGSRTGPVPPLGPVQPAPPVQPRPHLVQPMQHGGDTSSSSLAASLRPPDTVRWKFYCFHLPKHMHGRLAHFGALPTKDCPLDVKVKYEVDGQLLPEVVKAKAVVSGVWGAVYLRGLTFRGVSWVLHGCIKDGWSWCDQDGALVMRGRRAQQPALPAEGAHTDQAAGDISQSDGQQRPRQEGETANAERGSAAMPPKSPGQWLGNRGGVYLPKHMHGHLAHFGALPTKDCPLDVKVKYQVDGQLLPEVHEAKAAICNSKNGAMGLIHLARGTSWVLHGYTRDGWSWCDQDGALVMRGSRDKPVLPGAPAHATPSEPVPRDAASGSAAGPSMPAKVWDSMKAVYVPKQLHTCLADCAMLPTKGHPVAVKVKYEVDGQLLPEVHQAKAILADAKLGLILISDLMRGPSWVLHGCNKDGWSWCDQDGALVMRGSSQAAPAMPVLALQPMQTMQTTQPMCHVANASEQPACATSAFESMPGRVQPNMAAPAAAIRLATGPTHMGQRPQPQQLHLEACMPALVALAQQQGVPTQASFTTVMHRRLASHLANCCGALAGPPLPLQHGKARATLHRWALGSEEEVRRLWALSSLMHDRAAAFVRAALGAGTGAAGSGPASKDDSLPHAKELPEYRALVQAVQVMGRLLVAVNG